MTAQRIKVHRRSVRLAGRQYTVLSPRPTTDLRFATNRYHQTWHVLSSAEGGHFLGAVCRAMAFQRTPHTVFLIGPEHLVQNPFDTDASMPIAIVNRNLGGLPRKAAGQLCELLPLRTPPDGTVTLHTRTSPVGPSHRRYADRRGWTAVSHRLLVIAADRLTLCDWADDLAALAPSPDRPSNEVFLDTTYDGEVQVLVDFDRATAAASPSPP